MKILPTIFATILICILQMTAYALRPTDWNLFVPIGTVEYWLGIAMTHSYHYAEKFNFKPIDGYLISTLALYIVCKKYKNIYILSIFSLLLSWLPGAFSNFFQILTIEKVDNLITLFAGGHYFKNLNPQKNTVAISFSIGDVWIVLSSLYFFMNFPKSNKNINEMEFDKYVMANNLFKYRI
jgi:hypothetical protein